MAVRFVTDLDINQNELQNVAIQTVASLPASPVTGQIVLHSGDLKYWDGSAWVDVTVDTNTTYSAGNGISLSGTTFSVAGGDGLDQDTSGLSVDSTVVRTSGAQTIAGNKTFSNDVIINGDLTVSGNTITTLAEEVKIEDNLITLNSNVTTGTPTENAGVEVSRGSSAVATLLWDEGADRWYFVDDLGAHVIPRASEYTNNAGTITGVTAGDGLSGGGTSGGVTLNVDMLGIEDLVDPNDDRILFWDDSAGKAEWLDIGSGLSLSGTTLTATGSQRTQEEIEDFVGGMVTGNTETDITVTYADNGTGAGKLNFVNSYITAEVTVAGHGGGTYNLTGASVTQDFASRKPVLAIYERSGADYIEIATSVVYNGTSSDMDIELPAGDYLIVAHGPRA